ncbi:GNAT family N-acetyltransferase [Sphingobacterium paludis]|uniref:Ribosomal protein S18 acetylase RimI-like enzyme n=1 Tax=Sphingobacterium paludis TaxID=1476465 RepID=A0A4V3E1X9_9SPHI|nr:GNAT family N-acetyltransferase [Sphingobacterium paludis]TDS14868.1 ribosomal protein S18 acetylase RimI-like enzyme [Sphingobacterium paludis]
MGKTYTIRQVAVRDEVTLSSLANLTIDVVKNNASIGFMASLSFEEALVFWQQVLDRVIVGKVILLAAEDADTKQLIGTVQLLIDQPANQPHRADVAKMQVHSEARRLGIGEQLLRAIEEEAKKIGKHILVLDTVTGSPASYLYQKLGWIKVGDIPEYALFPDGAFCSTTYFYKKLR